MPWHNCRLCEGIIFLEQGFMPKLHRKTLSQVYNLTSTAWTRPWVWSIMPLKIWSNSILNAQPYKERCRISVFPKPKAEEVAKSKFRQYYLFFWCAYVMFKNWPYTYIKFFYICHKIYSLSWFPGICLLSFQKF